MKREGMWWGLAVLLCLLSGSAGAQETAQATPGAAPAGETKRAEPVVVTAERFEQRLEQTGASVTVVPEEAMQVQEYRRVDEVLRTVPGVQILTSGSPGKLSTVRIRGANPTQVQVLIDGVRVKSATSGDFDFADLTLDDIARVEVLRGPQSTLYGADAIGGVVNIITKRGQGPPSGFLDLEAGNYETFRERAGVSGSEGPWSYSLGVSRLDFGGQFDNDEHDLTSVNARIGYALPNKGELSLTGRFQDSHTGIPFATVFPDFDPNREQNQRLWLLSLEWRQPWTSMWEHRLRVRASMRPSSSGTSPIPSTPSRFPRTSPPGGSRRSGTTSSRSCRGTRPRSVASTGTRWARSRGATSRPVDSWAIVLQDQIALLDSLYLTGGIRYDGNSVFEDKADGPRGGLLSREGHRHAPEGELGPGLPRADKFNELFFPAFPPCGPFGNANLKPEESDGWDAGVEQHLWTAECGSPRRTSAPTTRTSSSPP